jgi:catechol 2,3-dioxygenase-like lactoylglutathione lyase family enzyme
VLGAEFLYGADEVAQRFRYVQYRLPGGGKLELVTPLGEGFLTRFLQANGEGLHHVTLKVDDLAAQVGRLEAAGIRPVLADLSDPDWREAFIHPRDAHGVLVQLAETPHDDESTAAHLAGRFPEAALLARRD